MKAFKVPFDIKREEKIFGGYLSLRQVSYLMITAASFGILATKILVILKIFFILTICIFFLLCAFGKINEINFDKMFFYFIKYIFRRKKVYL